MSLSRYKELEIIRNVDDEYKLTFPSRFSYNGINQYKTDTLKYPSEEERLSMTINTEIWKYGSRLYKYAQTYYGDPSYWWVIAWYNKLGTEDELSYGDSIDIPTPLDFVLTTYGL